MMQDILNIILTVTKVYRKGAETVRGLLKKMFFLCGIDWEYSSHLWHVGLY
jgi:hypothetical protein